MKQSVVTRRSAGRALLAIAVLISIVAGSLMALPAAAQSSQEPQVTVLSAALNVRTGPGTNYAVINRLKRGDQAAITGRHAASGWWQVKPANGSPGWVTGDPRLVQVSGDTGNVPQVAAPPAPSRSTARSSGKGIVVFQVASGGPIYVVNADGSGLRQLTTGIDPALSPDGKQVAFTRWDNPSIAANGSVWLINVDGSGERKIHDGVLQPKSPTWSPDGKRIVIGMQRGGRVDAQHYCGSNPPAWAMDIEVKVSKEGDELCFTLLAHPGWILRTLDLANGNYADQPVDKYSYSPAFDPANPWRVVYRGDQGLVNLDVNYGNVWPLTRDVSDRSPAFSPDGRKIAVSYRQHDHWEIHVMNADGSGRVRLTETPLDVTLAGKPVWNNAAPVWSPDGSKIAFVTDRTGRWEMWVMNADGSNQRPLLPASVQAKLPPLQYNSVDERVLSWR